MSIAEKSVISAENAQTIFENQQKVFDKGYEEGTLSVENYLPYATGLQFRNLNLFGKTDVVLNVPLLVNGSNMFRPNKTEESNTTVEHITINGGKDTLENMTAMFYFGVFWPADTKLRHITLNLGTSKVIHGDNMFGYCNNLEIVDGTPLDFSSIRDATIRLGSGTEKLAYVRFVPNTIKCNFNVSDSRAFTTETIDSIFDGLATVETAQTLTLHANLKILQSQVDSANSKGWTIAGGTVVSEEEYYA